jgi:hypothetical protein
MAVIRRAVRGPSSGTAPVSPWVPVSDVRCRNVVGEQSIDVEAVVRELRAGVDFVETARAIGVSSGTIRNELHSRDPLDAGAHSDCGPVGARLRTDETPAPDSPFRKSTLDRPKSGLTWHLSFLDAFTIRGDLHASSRLGGEG